MAQKLWVAYETPAKKFIDKVLIEGCDDIADFLKEIRVEFEIPGPPSHLTLYKPDGKTEIDVGDSPSLFIGENSPATPLFVKNTSGFEAKLERLEQEIKHLENSEEYQTLAGKNRPWALAQPTEQEKGEWYLLNEELDELKKKEDFYRKVILSRSANSGKKSGKTQKKYSKENAIRDERLLLVSIARMVWEKFHFRCENENMPTFIDLKRSKTMMMYAIIFEVKRRG